MKFIEFLKVILFGLVEGYTEFLPISSTGHLILVENLIHLDQPEEFFNVFKMFIQIGAILSVILIYWNKLWPFQGRNMKPQKRAAIWRIWGYMVVGSIPALFAGVFLEDYVDAKLSTPIVIGITLILYGIIFILMEDFFMPKHQPKIQTIGELDFKTAFLVGVFQCLAIIPGTSRSGATILGAMILGMSRAAGAEYSFYLGIPAICGAGMLKVLLYLLDGYRFTGEQILILAIGTVVSFITAIFVVRFLIEYLKKHGIKVFGWYRIVLGVIVLLYFGLAS